MKHILVPTDFSDCANNAVEFAVQTAKLFSLEISLLHAADFDSTVHTDSMGVIKEYNQSLINETKEKLNKLKKDIQEKEGILVNTIVAEYGLNDAIQKSIEETPTDLIIMGTLGASGLKEKIWGSKTASVIDSTTIPVLVIPHTYTWKKPEMILLATNHFENQPGLLNFIFEFFGLYKAQVHAAVFTDEDDDESEAFLDHARMIAPYEQTLKKHYGQESLTVSHLYGTEFESTLQSHIENNDIDILVMITYQRSFMDRIFHPSKTKLMAYHSQIPVLAIPAKSE